MAFTLLLAFVVLMISQIGGGWGLLTGLFDQSRADGPPGASAPDAASFIPYGSVLSVFAGIISVCLFIYFARNHLHGLVLYLVIAGGIGLVIRLFWLEPASNRISQVFGAQQAAQEAQAAVVEYFHETGRPPLNRVEAGLDADPTYEGSIYIRSVDIVQGAVVVTFSEHAATPLAGKSLAMTPYELDLKRAYSERNPDGVWSDQRRRFRIFWGCDVEGPVDFDLLGTAAGRPAIKLNTTIADEYLGPTCRR